MTTSEELLKNENVYNVPENLVFGVQQFLTDSQRWKKHEK